VPSLIVIAPRRLVVRESCGGAESINAHLAPVIDFIWEHAGQLRGVGDLCRQFQMSRRMLELLFEKHLGRSPAKEILRIRVERCPEVFGMSEHNMP
jgi:transcriptional regulator GlxA family with amidase domain